MFKANLPKKKIQEHSPEIQTEKHYVELKLRKIVTEIMGEAKAKMDPSQLKIFAKKVGELKRETNNHTEFRVNVTLLLQQFISSS